MNIDEEDVTNRIPTRLGQRDTSVVVTTHGLTVRVVTGVSTV